MCRWMAWLGQPVLIDELLFKSQHGIVDQSLHARMGAEPTNGDGFGLGWYGVGETPAVYRSVSPAWADANLRELAAHIESPLFLAHIRAAIGSPVQQTNCHPFRDGQHHVAPQHVHVVDEPVVHEQPAAHAKRVAVGLLHGRARRGADVGEEERRLDVGRQVLQVRVVPGRRDAAIAAGLRPVRLAVPADPEAVPVGGLEAHAGVQGLVDQAVLRLVEELADRERLAEVGVPAAHALIVVVPDGVRVTRIG